MGKKKDAHKSIEDRTFAAQVAIDNTLEIQGILNMMTLYGYNKKRLEVGKGLQAEVVDLVVKQKAEYGDQFEATNELKKAWQVSKKEYMKSLKIARIAFKNNKRANSALVLSGFIIQTTLFYDNLVADPKLLEGMKRFGYTKAKLMGEKKLVNAVIRLNRKQEKEKGEAQDATENRDKVIDKLDAWMSDFREVAYIALEDKPQWLEKLGIKDKS